MDFVTMPSQTKLPAAIWLMRVAWLAMPFTAGELLATALADFEPSFRTACSVGLWVLWGVVALFSWVLHPFVLGLLRVWVPAGLAGVCWAVVAGGESADISWAQATPGIVVAAVATIICLTPSVGIAYTDALGYPSERRLLLRPPLALLLGPMLLVWAVAVGGMLCGPLLLAAQRWLVGGIATPVGMFLAFQAQQSLIGLTRRWLVFVPAGIVVHDSLALGNEARLIETADIAEVGVASAAQRRQEAARQSSGLRHSEATGIGATDRGAKDSDFNGSGARSETNPGDLTMGAVGAAIDFHLSSPYYLPSRNSQKLRVRQRPLEAKQTRGTTVIRLAPSSLQQFIYEASRRGLVSLSDIPASSLTS